MLCRLEQVIARILWLGNVEGITTIEDKAQKQKKLDHPRQSFPLCTALRCYAVVRLFFGTLDVSGSALVDIEVLGILFGKSTMLD